MIEKYKYLVLLLILLALSDTVIACTVTPAKHGYNFAEKMAVSDNIFIISFTAYKNSTKTRIIEVLRGNEKSLAKIPISLTNLEAERPFIHDDLYFWLGRKSNSIVTSDCKIHYPFRNKGIYLLMAMKHELISLEPIESSNDEWVNFVRKNAQPPGRIEIPESVFYKSVKLKIRVNCTSQESEVLSIYSRINLAQYCKSPTKEYLLLSADGLDVFLPIKNGTVFLARQKNDLRFRIGFGDGAKNNDFFRGYVLSQQ